MKLKSLTNAELKEEILWANINMTVRQMEPRYQGQTREEQTKEYHELHALYSKYWDEAHRRGLVPLSSIEAESQAVLEKNQESQIISK
jgi:hypothetical protein